MNRIEPILKTIKDTKKEEDQMNMITKALSNTVTPIPEVGQHCTFFYDAKTKNLENGYDQHPLVSVFGLYNWGFEGLNYHWRKVRRYTWAELRGQVYIVKEEELKYLQSIPYGKFILNK